MVGRSFRSRWGSRVKREDLYDYGTIPSHESAVSSSVDTEDEPSTNQSRNVPVQRSPQSRNQRAVRSRTAVPSKESLVPQKKPSPVFAPLPYLNENEQRLFYRVGKADVAAVRELLSTGDLDVNKINRSGYSILHVAVLRQNEAMVEYLLEDPYICLYDTILHAIREKNVEITKLLLKKMDARYPPKSNSTAPASTTTEVALSSPGSPPQQASASGLTLPNNQVSPVSQGQNSSSSEDVGARRSATGITVKRRFFEELFIARDESNFPFESEFHPVITPLMLAAHVGCVELMEIFYEREDRLESKDYHHNKHCPCDICTKIKTTGDMKRMYQRQYLFKALCNPEYICFITNKENKKLEEEAAMNREPQTKHKDAVRYAIAKIRKLRDMQDRDHIYAKQYDEPLKKLEEFITKMLELCKDTTEAAIFMSPRDFEESHNTPHTNPRLWLAMGLKLRKFVASPQAQTILLKMWATDDWPEYESTHWFVLCIYVVICIPCFWLFGLYAAFIEDKKFRSPAGRFINHLGSYGFFLILMSFYSWMPYHRGCLSEGEGWKDKPWEWDETYHDKDCARTGHPRMLPYFAYEITLYAFWISLIISFIRKWRVSWFWKIKWNWYEACMIASFIATAVTFIAQIWDPNSNMKDIPRSEWPQSSLAVYGDCLFAVSCMFAWGKVLRYMQVSSTYGPIQVALGLQIKEFLKVGSILIVFILAATTGLLSIYHPYSAALNNTTDAKGGEVKQSDLFSGFDSAFVGMFWDIYGQGDHSALDIKDWRSNISSKYDEPSNKSANEIVRHPTITQYTGKFMFNLYHFVTVTMMFAMLSGYLANTLAAVDAVKDEHWKYNRAELFMTSMKDTFSPIFCNLLGCELFANIKHYCKLCTDCDKWACDCRRCCHSIEPENKKKWKVIHEEYPKLHTELIHRYLNHKEEAEEKELATKDDVKEIREELNEIFALFALKKKETEQSESQRTEAPSQDASHHEPEHPPASGTLSTRTTETTNAIVPGDNSEQTSQTRAQPAAVRPHPVLPRTTSIVTTDSQRAHQTVSREASGSVGVDLNVANAEAGSRSNQQSPVSSSSGEVLPTQTNPSTEANVERTGSNTSPPHSSSRNVSKQSIQKSVSLPTPSSHPQSRATLSPPLPPPLIQPRDESSN